MENENIGRVRFDYKFKMGDMDAKLIDYLSGDGDSAMFKKQMIQSARSYWMPLALKEAGVSQEQGRMAVNEAVADLLRQILRLCAEWNIDPLRYGVSFGSEAAGGLVSLSSLQAAASLQPPASASPTPPAAPESDSSSKGSKSKSVDKRLSGMSDLLSDWPVNED